MKALNLTNKQLENIYFEESERFELIKSEGWEQEHKFQTCEFEFEDATTGFRYKESIGRSGSLFTDWTYDSEMYEESYTLNPIEEIIVKVIKTVEVDNDRITETETIDKL